MIFPAQAQIPLPSSRRGHSIAIVTAADCEASFALGRNTIR